MRLKVEKTIEMRLFDEKRQKIKVGDHIVFTNIEGGEKIETKVIALHQFGSFADLYANFNKEALGYEKREKADPKDMAKYYDPAEQKQFGVVGIEIELL